MKDFEKYRKVFIERLEEYLNGKSILSVSKELGIPEPTLRAWIKKVTTPSMEYLILLAQKMNCSIDYLVGLEN